MRKNASLDSKPYDQLVVWILGILDSEGVGVTPSDRGTM